MKRESAARATLRVPEVAMTESSVSSTPETITDHCGMRPPSKASSALTSPRLCGGSKSHLGGRPRRRRPRSSNRPSGQAWEERANIASEADLTAFLHDACAAAAARELSRRAAARSLGRCTRAVATRRDRGGRCRHRHGSTCRDRSTPRPPAPKRRRTPSNSPSRRGTRRRSVEAAVVAGPGAHRHRCGGPRRRRNVVPHAASAPIAR